MLLSPARSCPYVDIGLRSTLHTSAVQYVAGKGKRERTRTVQKPAKSKHLLSYVRHEPRAAELWAHTLSPVMTPVPTCSIRVGMIASGMRQAGAELRDRHRRENNTSKSVQSHHSHRMDVVSPPIYFTGYSRSQSVRSVSSAPSVFSACSLGISLR